MYSNEIKRINSICIFKLIEELGEDLTLNFDFSTEKPFEEYFYSDAHFSQVSFKIKYAGHKFNSNKIRKNVSREEGEAFRNKVEVINSKLKEIQKEVASIELDEYTAKNYLRLSRVGYDIGICNVFITNRNKSEEEEEERLEYEEHIRRMNSDPKYKSEYEWENEQYRPYGGAFSSMEEYYRYIM